MESNSELDHLEPLLSKAGWRGDYQLIPLPRIGNNRVFKIQGDNQSVLLKIYFRDADDPRDRLKAEYSFASFLWNSGLKTSPQPLAQSVEDNMAIYEFMKGDSLAAAEVGPKQITEAAEFFCSINKFRETKEALALGNASEAFFSVNEQIASVQKRFSSLKKIEIESSAYHSEARQFVLENLLPAWSAVLDFVQRESTRSSIPIDAALSPGERCLSPSDFGFHNSVRLPEGHLRFFDFEYAGWDDPAKMVSDFYHQPRFRISGNLMPNFIDKVRSVFPQSSNLLMKIALVRPVFGIKWCCIMLNDFLPLGDRKRQFSVGDQGREERLVQRLKNAREQLIRVFPLTIDVNAWN